MTTVTKQPLVYTEPSQLRPAVAELRRKLTEASGRKVSGLCGFDGFIDTFIQVNQPATMAEFGGRIVAAAGIAASYPVHHVGNRFGGNGPILASALHGMFGDAAALSYIGALGRESVAPIFQVALGRKMKMLHTLADPAHSDCLEFKDGKIMLSDVRSCAEITWERLLERVTLPEIDRLLHGSEFIAAVNWGKLVNVGALWMNLALRLRALGVPRKKTLFYMDLAEFEQRPRSDREQLEELFATITAQCTTVLSLNLKEAWQLAELRGGDFTGRKEPAEVARLTLFLKEAFPLDRVIVHPNDGAACASETGCVYVPGPYCREPLISTGAGDNFGAGSLSAALCGCSDVELVLLGCCTSGYFVRSGRSPSFAEAVRLADLWMEGRLPDRL